MSILPIERPAPPAARERAWPIPAGGRVYCALRDGDRCLIHVLEPRTGEQVLPGQTAAVNVLPAVSPDGRRIAWTAGETIDGCRTQIVNMAIGSDQAKALYVPQKRAMMPAWSPDSQELAFVAGDEFITNVYVASIGGCSQRQINPVGTGGVFPFWTRDGRSVGYTRVTRQGAWAEIVLACADGSVEAPLTPAGRMAVAGAEAVSPDGRQLAYLSADPDGKAGSIRLRDLETGVERELDWGWNRTPTMDSYPSPTWAPDGGSLLVRLVDGADFGLFLVTASGQRLDRVSAEGTDCCGVSWARSDSPIASEVLAASTRGTASRFESRIQVRIPG